MVQRKRLLQNAGTFFKKELPPVSVVISAYNEEKCIVERINNILESDFPPEKIFVWIGVDGSMDGTAAKVKGKFDNDKRVYVVEFPERKGKAAVIKNIVDKVDTQIIVFTDANTLFAKDTIKKLVMHLYDKKIGSVCGKLIFNKDKGKVEAENIYWNFENKLKEAESIIDSCLGVNGAVYAIRKDEFWKQLPDNTIVEDFVIGMKVRERGKKVVFLSDAIAYENLPAPSWEWYRRVRIGAGDFQALRLCWRCLCPQYGLFAWMFFSHKVLRWIIPVLTAGIVIAALVDLVIAVLVCGTVSLVSFAILTGGAVVLVIAMLLRNRSRGVGGVFQHFVFMQMAVVFGFIKFCMGGLKGYWEPVPRDRN